MCPPEVLLFYHKSTTNGFMFVHAAKPAGKCIVLHAMGWGEVCWGGP